LVVWSILSGYPSAFQWPLALTCLITAVSALVAACKDTIRGLERTDIPAYAHVAQHAFSALLVAIVLMLGGDLRACRTAQATAAIAILIAMCPALRRIGVTGWRMRWDSVATLLQTGTPFMALGLVLALQPNVDAAFLAKLSPVEVMGWYAVARRFIGTLLLP